MNSTIRTINGYRLTIGIGAAIFLLAALIVLLSPLFAAQHGEQPTDP